MSAATPASTTSAPGTCSYARGWERLGPATGENFAKALWPYIVTDVGVVLADAAMIAEVDGETWSEGTPGEMHHSFADIVAHVSQSETLCPGDVLDSETVGEGWGFELGGFL